MEKISLLKQELADIAGYSYRRLFDIDKELPDDKKLFVPGEESGKYDLALFVQRWTDYLTDTAKKKVKSLDIVKAKHEAVKTEKTELEVARMRGELIDVIDVRQLWGNIANTVMHNLLVLPNKIAPLVIMMDNTEEIKGIIDTEIRKVLEALADTPMPDYADFEVGKEDIEDDEES